MKDGSESVANVSITTSTASGGMVVTSGLIGWVNEYAVVIGLGISLLSLLIGLYFHIQTVKWRKEQTDQKIKEAVDAALNEQAGN